MNTLLQRVYLNNTWEDDRGIERRKIYKTIIDSIINQQLLSLIFPPLRQEEIIIIIPAICWAPLVCKTVLANTFYYFLQRKSDTSSSASMDYFNRQRHRRKALNEVHQ